MFKKTKVRSIYDLFYPDKFKYKIRYAAVDYSYVHKELKKTGVTLTSHVEHKPGIEIEVDWSGPTMSYVNSETGELITAYLFAATMPYSQKSYVEATIDMKEPSWLQCHVNMFKYFGGTPVKLVCDNLKTGVTSHPKHGEIILNDAYLTLGEYYQVAILPTGVKKPKHKPSVEGTVCDVATAIIARLRNEVFTSLRGLNAGILRALEAYNEKPFQKRFGSRNLIYENEEKPLLRALPMVSIISSFLMNGLITRSQRRMQSFYMNCLLFLKYRET